VFLLTNLLEEFGLDLRVFHCMKVGKRIVMLHSFIKKSQETPKRELAIGRRRQKEVSAS